MTYPGGPALGYAFNELDQFANVNAGGVVGVGPGYDPLGRLAFLGRYTAHATHITYDAADRIKGRARTSPAVAMSPGPSATAAGQLAAPPPPGRFDWTKRRPQGGQRLRRPQPRRRRPI